GGVVGESRQPPPRPGDPPLPRRSPLDHLRPRVPGAPAAAVAAAPLHLPVLPRRGGLVRRRPPAVRRMPPPRLQRLSRRLGGRPRGRSPLRQGHEPAAARRADRGRDPPPPVPRAALG